MKKEALGEYVRQTWGWNEQFQRKFHMKDFDPSAIQIISWFDTDVGWVELDSGQEEIRLSGIYVLPDYQNRGVGTAVIKHVLREASESKRPVTLQVLKVNTRARALYERLGFVLDGETETHDLMKLGS